MTKYKINGYRQLNYGDDAQLRRTIANVGPVAVIIDASSDAFKSYASGIFNINYCSSNDLDHVVLAVGKYFSLFFLLFLTIKGILIFILKKGYGTENGRNYWLKLNFIITYLIYIFKMAIHWKLTKEIHQRKNTKKISHQLLLSIGS